jgi:hypothetical protein
MQCVSVGSAFWKGDSWGSLFGESAIRPIRANPERLGSGTFIST